MSTLILLLRIASIVSGAVALLYSYSWGLIWTFIAGPAGLLCGLAARYIEWYKDIQTGFAMRMIGWIGITVNSIALIISIIMLLIWL